MNAERGVFDEHVTIAGPRRRLEGCLTYPADAGAGACALIAGPHPLLGGDMQNNVVRALVEGLAGGGATVLAFNYSGVGESEGGPADWPAAVSTFWRDGRIAAENDWLEDARAAQGMLAGWCARPPVVIGYSFGCWIAGHLAAQRGVPAVLLISPNPSRHDFTPLAETGAPLLVVHSDNDFTAGVDELAAWFDGLREPKSRVLLTAGEHFFRRQESEVARTVAAFLDRIGVLERTGTP